MSHRPSSKKPVPCFLRASACIILISLLPSTSAAVRYVDPLATGAGDGTSWGDAYTDLQAALAAARVDLAITEIRVAGGTPSTPVTYFPTGPAAPIDRTISFDLVDGVNLRGGFRGLRDSGDNRNIQDYLSILSGDVDMNDPDPPTTLNGDNSYHVVTAVALSGNTRLERFEIRQGYANGDGAYARGGGLLIDRGSPMVVECTIAHNHAETGGGIYIDCATPSLVGTATPTQSFRGSVSSNRALQGAGVYIEGGAPELLNMAMSLNTATQEGGGLYCVSSAPVLRSVFLSYNTAVDGGGMYFTDSTPLLIASFSAHDIARRGGGAFVVDCASANWIGREDGECEECALMAGGFSSDVAQVVEEVEDSGIGGAVYIEDSNVQFKSTYFAKNAANIGAAVCATSSSVSIVAGERFSEFYSNGALVSGGALYATAGCDVNVTGARFDSNSAALEDGGAILIDSGALSVRFSAFGCPFNGPAGNWAGSNGGAIASTGATFVCVTRSMFHNNRARDGAAIDVNGDAAISNSLFFRGNIIENTIPAMECPELPIRRGGAIRVRGNDKSMVRISNCAFIANDADEGGAIYSSAVAESSSPHLDIVNATLATNRGFCSGGGVFAVDTILTVRNSILWANDDGSEASRDVRQIRTSTSAVTVTSSCIEDDEVGGTIPFGGSANDNIDEDPLFIGDEDDPLDYGKVDSASPCVDTGNNDWIPADDCDVDGDGNTTEQAGWDLAGERRRQGPMPGSPPT